MVRHSKFNSQQTATARDKQALGWFKQMGVGAQAQKQNTKLVVVQQAKVHMQKTRLIKGESKRACNSPSRGEQAEITGEYGTGTHNNLTVTRLRHWVDKGKEKGRDN